jgi:hypothetical protein
MPNPRYPACDKYVRPNELELDNKSSPN